MSKKVILSVRQLNSFTKKSLGLMFEEKPESVFLTTRFGIHTFLMKYSIDVLICDSDLVVRKTKSDLRPNRLFFWNPSFGNVIEMPSGSIKRKNIIIGDKLQLEILN